MNEGFKKRIQERLPSTPTDPKTFTQAICELIEDTFPTQQDSVLNIKQKADKFKADIFNYVDSKKHLFPGTAKEDPKIGVVSHSMFMKVLTAKDEYWEKVFQKEPEEA